MIKRIFLIGLCLAFLIYPVELNAAEETAVFAGGCFWCLEHDMEIIPGVINVESGYSGGSLENPTYSNHKGHQEVVRVAFDSEKITYNDLLRSYWRNIDPLDSQGQFCDRGDSYKPVIFVGNQSQNDSAELSLKKAADELNLLPDQIRVQIQLKKKFWLAESYHQNYAKFNNVKYKFYRYACGRDKRLINVWGEDYAGSSNPWH